MREIKFRAWFKSECEMKEVAINNIYKGNNTFLYLSPLPMSDYKPVDLMQYTGLKDDKNCKEIYEGDILKAVAYALNKVVIGVVKYNSELAHYYLDTNIDKRIIFLGLINTEVIGNIYEDVELLEVKE